MVTIWLRLQLRSKNEGIYRKNERIAQSVSLSAHVDVRFRWKLCCHSDVVQELGGEVGTVGPLDGVARKSVLRELFKVEQLAEHLARQVGLQVAEFARPVAEGEQQLVVLHIVNVCDSKHIVLLSLFEWLNSTQLLALLRLLPEGKDFCFVQVHPLVHLGYNLRGSFAVDNAVEYADAALVLAVGEVDVRRVLA